MDRELIDHVWKYCLPKEFKEEVKEIYLNAVEHHPCGYNHKTDLMKYLFGRHNLTSDAVEEEMLTVPRKKVEEKWQRAYEQEAKYSRAQDSPVAREELYYNRGILSILDTLFGSKCLPDEKVSNPTPLADLEPCTEPKFKIGDKVRVKFNAKELHSNPDPSKNIYYWQTARDKYLGKVFKITDIWKSGTITLNTAEVMFWEPFDLEPYTEPKDDKHFDNILKDSFAKERRLNIAAQIVASMISSDDWTTWRGGTNKEIWHNMAKSSLEIADALIDECEKKGGQDA